MENNSLGGITLDEIYSAAKLDNENDEEQKSAGVPSKKKDDAFSAENWFIDGELTDFDQQNEDSSKTENEKSSEKALNNVTSQEKTTEKSAKKEETEKVNITNGNVKGLIKTLNPAVCNTKKFLLFIVLISLVAAIAFIAVVPYLMLIPVVFMAFYRATNKKYKALKATVLSLNTVDKLEYYRQTLCYAYGEKSTFRYDYEAVYGKSNTIFSVDNVVFIYPEGKHIFFGLTNEKIVKFDVKLNQENQQDLIARFKKINPSVTIGKVNNSGNKKFKRVN